MSSEESQTEIEGLDGDLQAAGKASRWEQFRLPVELAGKCFLDVGCWEGVHCAEAVRRGADSVVGVDICTCPDLTENVGRYGFEFLQMDVFGDHWQGLDRFDVVLCSGLIYHVPNPMALLMRLRAVSGELLVIETASTSLGGDEPMMMFQDDEAGNPSNWWIPNRACIESDARDGRLRRDLDRLGGGRARSTGAGSASMPSRAPAWGTIACSPASPA